MELANKVAVITGASSGIGAAVACNLNDAGVNLILTGRREYRLVELKEELSHLDIRIESNMQNTVYIGQIHIYNHLPNQLISQSTIFV